MYICAFKKNDDPLPCVFAFQDSVWVWDWRSSGGFVWERMRKRWQPFCCCCHYLEEDDERQLQLKPCLLGTKEGKRGGGIILFRRRETNTKLNNYEQHGSFYQVGMNHYPSTLALTPPPSSSLVIHRTGLHIILSIYQPFLHFPSSRTETSSPQAAAKWQQLWKDTGH